MKIVFKFVYDNSIIYVPDGHVNQITIQDDFLEWIHSRPENIVKKNNRSSYCFNSDDFLEYLNVVVLSNVNERAYFLEKNIEYFTKEKNMLVLKF